MKIELPPGTRRVTVDSKGIISARDESGVCIEAFGPVKVGESVQIVPSRFAGAVRVDDFSVTPELRDSGENT